MWTRRTVLAGLSAGLAGCGLDADGRAEPATDVELTPPSPATDSWYTHPQRSGNRTLDGAGDLETADPVAFSPTGEPQWLVARPDTDGSRWTVATADGRVTDWHIADGTATKTQTFDSLPAETQPVVTSGADGVGLLEPPKILSTGASPIVTPARDSESKLLYVARNGDLIISGSETTRLTVDALPDGRLAAIGDGRYAVFGGATDRYRHGALGDSIEAGKLFVIDAESPEIVAQATIDPPAVFEGIQPLVADLNGDGTPEIITTVADTTDGARIAVFNTDCERLATGPIHEPGWRHQLTVAPFGPDGGAELAVVRKPHVDQVVEFYRLRGGSLEITAAEAGFSSHTFGSRILDSAVAGQFDGNDATQLLVPTSARDELAAVRRVAGSVTTDWALALGGRLASNVTGTTLPDGRVAVGASNGQTVRVWQG